MLTSEAYRAEYDATGMNPLHRGEHLVTDDVGAAGERQHLAVDIEELAANDAVLPIQEVLGGALFLPCFGHLSFALRGWMVQESLGMFLFSAQEQIKWERLRRQRCASYLACRLDKWIQATPSRGARTEETTSLDDAAVEARLRRFYARYNPDKLTSVPEIMTNFRGRETLLFDTLVDRYGPEPSETSSTEVPLNDLSSEAPKTEEANSSSSSENTSTATMTTSNTSSANSHPSNGDATPTLEEALANNLKSLGSISIGCVGAAKRELHNSFQLAPDGQPSTEVKEWCTDMCHASSGPTLLAAVLRAWELAAQHFLADTTVDVYSKISALVSSTTESVRQTATAVSTTATTIHAAAKQKRLTDDDARPMLAVMVSGEIHEVVMAACDQVFHDSSVDKEQRRLRALCLLQVVAIGNAVLKAFTPHPLPTPQSMPQPA